jgi:16S rRNA (adenine1518-N6/adenine1519-N6)-dimethyltransferase
MKRLGQHFLKDKSTIKKIVSAIDLKAGDTIIEIGPGHGELTQELRIEDGELRIIVIEKDRELVTQDLNPISQGNKNFEVIEGDALKLLIPLSYKLRATSYKIVGNIPYYITGHLLRIIGELENKPSLCVFTIQREVAERIVARPPKMNRLAASVQFWAEPKIVSVVPKRSFEPTPKVDSAIIKLETRSAKHEIRADDERYYKTVRILFQQPRKTLLNNILEADRRGLSSNPRSGSTQKGRIIKRLIQIGVNPGDRPQNLTIDDIKKIAGFVS